MYLYNGQYVTMLSYLDAPLGGVHSDHISGEVVQGDVDLLALRDGDHPGGLG